MRQSGLAVAAANREPAGGPAGGTRWAAAETATEVAAMTCAARAPSAVLPVAELLSCDLAERTGYGLVLTACVPGTSMIPPEPT